MIIRSMTASFGVLDHRTLELKPGLNIIEAPNESGKSTWCAFIRAMLYGLDASRKDRGGARPDKLRFSPWSGAPMEGVMELTWQGKDVTVSRSSPSAAAPMRDWSAVYSGTGRSVRELSGADAGELLTGVPEAVFRRTAFIDGMAVAVTQTPELEKRIAAVASSGEEDASYTEAAERLKSWKRSLRYREQGKLPALDREIAALDAELDRREKAETELAGLYGEEATLEQALQERDESADSDSLQYVLGQAMELDREAELRAGESERIRRELQNGVLHGREPTRQLCEEVRADARRLRTAAKDAAAPIPGRAGWMICFALALVLSIIGLRLKPMLFIAAASLLGGSWMLVRYLRLARRKNRAVNAAERLKKKYAVPDGETLEKRLGEYRSQYEEYEALVEAERELRKEGASLRSAAGKLVRQESEPDPEREKIRLRLEEVRRQKAVLLSGLDKSEDPASLRERLAADRARRALLEQKEKALDAALEALAEAEEELRSRFSPALSRKTAELFIRLTDGKYDDLVLDDSLSASVRLGGEIVYHDVSFLSRGARQQLYLALRLALCTLLPAQEPCPLILDDALLSFDDERLRTALDVLSELAVERQILLYTCQKRERKLLKTDQATVIRA